MIRDIHIETAKKMLQECARRALWRLEQSEPDVRTVAEQMEQTAKLAKEEMKSQPCSA